MKEEIRFYLAVLFCIYSQEWDIEIEAANHRSSMLCMKLSIYTGVAFLKISVGTENMLIKNIFL